MKRKRTQGRDYAIQMLYSATLADNSVNETKSSFRLEYADEAEDILDFADKLFETAYKNKEKDEAIISELINKNWTIDRIGAIERCILRLGISELFEGDAPYYAVIDDYVTLAKNYGDEKSASFVNGILENVKNKFSIELNNGRK